MSGRTIGKGRAARLAYRHKQFRGGPIWAWQWDGRDEAEVHAFCEAVEFHGRQIEYCRGSHIVPIRQWEWRGEKAWFIGYADDGIDKMPRRKSRAAAERVARKMLAARIIREPIVEMMSAGAGW